MKRAWTLAATAICIVLLGCENDETPTAIRVIVDSDLELGRELAKLEVRVFDPAGKEEWRRQDFALSQARASTQFSLPLSFRLAPQSQGSTRDFLLVVTGVGPLGEGGSEIEVVEQQALASFRPGETLRLDMFLAKTCLLELCRQDGERSVLSCDVQTGSCQQIPHRETLPVARGDGIDDYEEDKADAGNMDTFDADTRALDGGIAEDVAPEDAHPAPDGVAPAGIAQVGHNCEQEGEKSCRGNNSTDTLQCSRGRWVPATTCDANQRCDTAEGVTRGTCRAIPMACLGAMPGQVVCDGTRKLTCGDDLLDYFAENCGANQHCTSAGSVACTCDDGFQSDGLNGCSPTRPGCSSGACLNAGVCMNEPNGYRCECAGTGFQGAACETDIDECAAPTPVCLDEYPCWNVVGSFLCRGQQANWPMPDSWMGARTQPSYVFAEGGPIVEDSVTRLMWQRTVPAAYPGCSGIGTSDCTMSEAAGYCQGLELGGYNDWALPTKIELESILDDVAARDGGPAVNETAFPNTPEARFWSASYDVTGTFAWLVHFAPGISDPFLSREVAKARCVRRPGFPPITRIEHYTLSPDNTTVKDNWTGLVWQRSGSGSPLSWTEAQGYCPAGFRLPTRKELLTLVNPSREDPAIDVAVFPATPSDGFWSSSDTRSGRYIVDFLWGSSAPMPENRFYYVRCIK